MSWLSGRKNVVRTVAWAVVITGAATPLVRKRLGLRPAATLAMSAASPLALAVVAPRSKKRDLALYVLQMWAYFGAYSLPGDNPDKLMRRVHVDYPIKADRIIGFGVLPTTRLQGSGHPGQLRPVDYLLTWSHWLWYLFPHGTVIYTLVRHNKHFPRTAAMIALTFDLGAIIYWAVPTAPPWWAGKLGRMAPVRRIIVEVGERIWGKSWPRMQEALEGNPVAAMPSLHCGTSVMAARMLSEVGPLPGAIGWAYALTLSYGLIHLGEHYVVDLAAGVMLAELVRRSSPQVEPISKKIVDRLQTLQMATRS